MTRTQPTTPKPKPPLACPECGGELNPTKATPDWPATDALACTACQWFGSEADAAKGQPTPNAGPGGLEAWRALVRAAENAEPLFLEAIKFLPEGDHCQEHTCATCISHKELRAALADVDVADLERLVAILGELAHRFGSPCRERFGRYAEGYPTPQLIEIALAAFRAKEDPTC